MLNKILKLDGVKSLSKKMQQKISGSGIICGDIICPTFCECIPKGDYCIYGEPFQGQYCPPM